MGLDADDPDRVPFHVDDADLQEEQAQFAGHKRRRHRTKEQAIYGIWAESEDEEFDQRKPHKSAKWLESTNVSFVQSQKPPLPLSPTQATLASSGANTPHNGDSSSPSDSADSNADTELTPRPMGLGASISSPMATDAWDRPALGLGRQSSAMSTPTFMNSHPNGRGHQLSSQPRTSPVPSPASSMSTDAPSTPVPKEFAQFTKHSGGVALKMMMKMGYKFGQGLGASGKGIVNPIETKLRPSRMGLSYKGFKEKTAQARETELQRNQAESPATVTLQSEKAVPTGRSKKPSKPRVVYQSVAEVISRVETRLQPPGTGKVLDMTGPETRNLASVSEWAAFNATPAPVTDTTTDSHEPLPSVSDDVRLIIDLTQAELDDLANDEQAQGYQQKVLAQEQQSIHKLIAQTQAEITQVETVTQYIDQCTDLADQFAAVPPGERLEVLAELVTLLANLHQEFAPQWQEWSMEIFVVATLANPLKAVLADWEPLHDPTFLLDLFRILRPCMSTHDRLYPQSERRALNAPPLDPRDDPIVFSGTSVAGDISSVSRNTGVFSTQAEDGMDWDYIDTIRRDDTPMTPYESLMYQVWLPPLRSALVNHWNVYAAHHTSQRQPTMPNPATAEDPAVRLLEAWRPPVAPIYVYLYVLEHVVVPKLTQAIEHYNDADNGLPKLALHLWLHPWLPILGDRMGSLLTPVRHQLAVRLKKWHPSEPYGHALVQPWVHVLQAQDLDRLVRRYIVPKLQMALHQELTINPRSQNMDPFHWVMAWQDVVPPSTLATLLVGEFFPKWHRVLAIWLQQAPHFEQITQWYLWWKSVFPEPIRDLPTVASEFRKGLDAINQSLDS
ncbi:hypothetical protein H4R34_002238 [Dimargaris verticillata]|uniref:G-patch domain-containing protein n=1 Tax=Dimargaris verticillata TaxID=2761393 RepID=A0A9W8B4J6_9FUNG|nr:hypothetical protein H4R34_002238 [Dimargaris verticillata]